MRSIAWWLWLVVAVFGLNTATGPSLVLAAEEEGAPRYAERHEQNPPPAMRSGQPAPGCQPCRWRGACFLKCLAGLLVLIHVLLAIWVYTDIRKRGEGHGIFIVLALLGGIPATILYALVRIGDRKV